MNAAITPGSRPEEVGEGAELSERWCELARWGAAVGALACAAYGALALSLRLLGADAPGALPWAATSSSLALVMGGVALLLGREAAPSTTRGTVARVLGALVSLLGLAVLISYFTPPTIDLDPGFRFESWRNPGVRYARPAPGTGLCMVLSGLAIMLLDYETRRRRRPAQYLGVAAAWLTFVALSGYAFGLAYLYGEIALLPYGAMPADTAVAFAVLALAILAARPGAGFMRRLVSAGPGGVALRRFLPAGLGVVVLGATLVLGHRADDEVEQVVVSGVSLSAPILLAALLFSTARALDRAHGALVRAEAEAQRNAAQLRLTVGLAPITLFVQDTTLRYIWLENSPVSAVEEIVGCRDSDLLSEDEAATLTALKQRVLDTGLAERCELEVYARGARRTYDLALEPIFPEDAAGTEGRRPVGLRGAAIEITERKREEQRRMELLDRERVARALAELEQARLAEVLAQIPEPVLVTDAGGRVQQWSRTAEAWATQPLRAGDSCLEASPFDLRSPSGQPTTPLASPLPEALREGKEHGPTELLVLRPDGRAVPVLARAAPILDGRGELAGAVMVLEDISVLKEAERRREEWTSVVAHDLRNPIGVITLSSQLIERLLQSPDLEQALKSTRRIHAAARALQRMIDDLLDVSRLEARGLELHLEPVDPEAVVREVVERRRLMSAGPIELEVTTPLPQITADPARLEQVLENLLSNAAKYGEPGAPVRVSIRVSIGASPDHVEIAVVNRGRGFTPEESQRLFSRFFRTPGARADTKQKGLGLGLYITKGLVEAHGGQISAESVPDQTTTFRFTLPLAPVGLREGTPG